MHSDRRRLLPGAASAAGSRRITEEWATRAGEGGAKLIAAHRAA